MVHGCLSRSGRLPGTPQFIYTDCGANPLCSTPNKHSFHTDVLIFVLNSPTVELVLNDVVEDLKEVKDEVVVGWLGKEEPLCGEGLHQMHQPGTRHH